MPAETRLASDHRAIDALLANAFAALESERAEEAHEALDRAWMRLAVHIRAEHKALFPVLLAERPELESAIAELKVEHDVFMAGMARLLPRLKSPAPDFHSIHAELRALDARLQDHNRREEAHIYPNAEESADLDARIAAELAFLPERYKT
ncbi:MAG: hemerythrin domain-containing protein [Acidobacteria bacterium]|nr:hemerythrin domain-containing protein [Acidobacteriota bacterium]